VQTQFLQDVGLSSYFNILTQYSDSSGAAPVNAPSFVSSWEDTGSYPHSGTIGDPLQQSDISNEVAHAIQVNNWQVSPDDVVLVYTALGTQTKHTGLFGDACAYHSYFTYDSTNIAYAYMQDAGNNLTGCGGIATGSPNHDPTADVEVSLASHELAEAITDPFLNGWYASNDEEISDLCQTEWSIQGGNVSLNGNTYPVEDMYSNYDHQCVSSYSGKSNQSITFLTQRDLPSPEQPTTPLGVSDSAGLSVTVTSTTPGVCAVVLYNISHTGLGFWAQGVEGLHPGICTLVASQGGNAYYNPAPQVTQSFTIFGTKIVNDTDSGITYGGGTWKYLANTSNGDYDNDVHMSGVPGSFFSYTFSGTGVMYVSEVRADLGIVHIYIDGALKAAVNCNRGPILQAQQNLFSISGLVPGQHTIKVVSFNQQPSGIMLDYMSIL
jgi:hypothetical protein